MVSSSITKGQKQIFVSYLVVVALLVVFSIGGTVSNEIKRPKYDVPAQTTEIIIYSLLLIAITALSSYLVYYVYHNSDKSNFKRGLFTGLSVMLPVSSLSIYLLKFFEDTLGLGALIFYFFIFVSIVLFLISTILGIILIKMDNLKFNYVINSVLLVFIIPTIVIFIPQLLFLLSYFFT